MWNKTISLYRDAYRGLPRDAWILALAEFINRCGFMVLVFLNIYLTRRLGFSLIQAGQVLSAFGLGSILGGYLGGHLTDRIGVRPIQIGSLVLSGMILIAAGYARTFLPALALLFLYGLTSAAIFPANDTAMTGFCAGERLTKGFALRRLASNLGITFGPVVGGFLVLIDYRWLFWADGLTTLASAAVIALLLKPVPVLSSPAAAAVRRGHSPWRDGPYLAFLGLLLVQMTVFSQIFSTFNLYLNSVYGLPENRIGLLWAVNTVLIVSVEMVLVHKLGKRSPVRMVALGGAMTCLGFALLPFGRGFAYAAFTVVVWTFGEILTMPYASTLAASRAGSAIGRYMGLYSLMFSAGMFIAPYAGNWLYAEIGGNALWPVAGGAGILASAGILALKGALERPREGEGGPTAGQSMTTS
ncbi:MAG: MFS transporter [Candidatus Aminicenantes bacterium]|nr:MFS transporter [Candidatus Aminicenantes bacterium]